MEADPESVGDDDSNSEKIEESEVFPACVVTRAIALKERDHDDGEENNTKGL